MNHPQAPNPAQHDTRAAIARNILLFVCGASPKTIAFAQRRLVELFGIDFIEEADLRAEQMKLLAEATAALTALRRGGGPS